jgi:hypothetical protein
MHLLAACSPWRLLRSHNSTAADKHTHARAPAVAELKNSVVDLVNGVNAIPALVNAVATQLTSADTLVRGVAGVGFCVSVV